MSGRPIKPHLTPADWGAAATELAERHDVCRALLERHGAPRLRPQSAPTERFEALASAIAYQQLAGAAAAAIWSRVVAAVGRPFTPAGVLDAGYGSLRSAGFSDAKARSVLDLAARVQSGEVRLERIGRLGNREVTEHLTVVRGIGPWTAQMFLLFELRRLDVWPTGDFGVRAGLARAFELEAPPTEREMVPLGDPFQPYRSVLAWWCWREVDTPSEFSA